MLSGRQRHGRTAVSGREAVLNDKNTLEQSMENEEQTAPVRAQETSLVAQGEKYGNLLRSVCHGEEVDLPDLLDACEEQIIFITGLAGSGKTAGMKRWLARTKKRVVVCAPTGVAALLCGGTTIHRAFGLPITIMDAEAIEQCAMRQRKYVRFADAIVIDEASMVLGPTLDTISAILQKARRNSRPFGGMQVILFGDLFQLPPVSRDDEWAIINRNNEYDSQFFFSSKVLKAHPPVMFNLTKLFRQDASETEFIDILNAVRIGKVSDEMLARLNQRVRPGFGNVPGYVHIAATNREVDRINKEHLESLPLPERVYQAAVFGDFKPSDAPCDSPLRLRVGAQVMITANALKPKKEKGKDADEDEDDNWVPPYANGTVGEVVALNDNSVSVKTDGGVFTLTAREWEKVKYEVTREEDVDRIVSEPTGSLSQIPLRLAAAITAHKVQGQSLDKAIVDSGSIFEVGQLYVALSRLRTLNNLVLKVPVTRNVIMSATGVTQWYDMLKENGRLLDVRQKFVGNPEKIEKKIVSPVQEIIESLSAGVFLTEETMQRIRKLNAEEVRAIANTGVYVLLDQITHLMAELESAKKKTPKGKKKAVVT